MAVTKLSIYNDALSLLGQRQLSSDTVDEDTRRFLDKLFTFEAIEHCLEVAQPTFARKTVELVGVSGKLGNVFNFPADYNSLIDTFSDATQSSSSVRRIVDGNTFSCKISPVFLRYVSLGVVSDFTLWTSTFAHLVSTWIARDLAVKIAPALVGTMNELYQARLQQILTIESLRDREGQDLVETTGSDKLAIFNNALSIVGQPPLTSLTQEVGSRYLLNSTYNLGAVNHCLELVKPSFASKLLESAGVVGTGKLDTIHTLPADYVTLDKVYSDKELDQELSRYVVTGNKISCDIDTIYIRYITNTADEALYTPSFTKFLSIYLAREITPKFAPEGIELISSLYDQRLEEAKLLNYIEPKVRPSSRATTLDSEWMNIYNDALLIMGLDEINDANDDSNRRAKLDRVLNAGLVSEMLEDEPWLFALTSDKVSYDPSLHPVWGYTYTHKKPDNMLRINGIYTDENMNYPLKRYKDEGNNFYSSHQVMYIEYVNRDFIDTHLLWPTYFKRLVASKMAKDASKSLRNEGANIDASYEEFRTRETSALSNNAMASPPRIIRDGAWSAARRGRYNNNNGRP